jgi:hypothetical protein
MGGSIPTRRSVVLTARGDVSTSYGDDQRRSFGACFPNTMSATILVVSASDQALGIFTEVQLAIHDAKVYICSTC